MKPPVFDYEAPDSLDAALDALARHGEDGKVLAGGQSLVPLLNFRLARPKCLIDVNRVGGLSTIRREDGTLRIGTLTRHASLERSALVAREWPLLNEAVGLVAHGAIRNRGTVGGSVTHADPAAELPVAFAALDARFRVASAGGTRTVGWEDLFVTHLTTSLQADELLTEIEVPPLPERTGSAFAEYARRHGDFALAGAAVVLTVDAEGACTSAAVALLAAAPTPVRARDAEAALAGMRIDEATAESAARAAVAGFAPVGDIHGDAEYRRVLLQSLVRRAIVTAARRATGEAT